MLLEILAVLLLTVINGVLSMSELAVVSSRSGRLKVMAEDGVRGAQAALDLAESPGKFLSSVQLGITLIGILAGAVSGGLAMLGPEVALLFLAGLGIVGVLVGRRLPEVEHLTA